MTRFSPWRVGSSHLRSDFSILGILLGVGINLLFPAVFVQAAPDRGVSTPAVSAPTFEPFEEQSSLATQVADICDWERSLGFFLTEERSETLEKSERIDCADRFQQNKTDALGTMREEFRSGDELLARELGQLVADFPIVVMAEPIARYDREIAGLIIGIGKKESNWGKRTPKLNGEECYNFWGYRGAGTRGFTPDGYGCWETPAEAVKTIGDRLVKLRELRLSAEPSRMIVWKCGSSCAGHSDESVRKWIADVDIYYRKIAKQ